jgi:hypothetical protein
MKNPTKSTTPIRRVYRPEVRDLTGWSEKWLGHQIKAGRWPAPLRDPGSRRGFWLNGVVFHALSQLNNAATAEPVTAPACGKRKRETA